MKENKKPIKKEYFTVKQLDKIAQDGDYIFLIGERANGKSYSVKSRCLLDCYESIKGNICYKQLAYMRRYDLDNKDSKCTAYFADMPIQEITDGKYTLVTVFRKDIYFGHMDDKGKVVRDVKIGHTFSIGASEHEKSLMYPHMYNVIFEEVIAMTGTYLYNEPILFMHAISSILRDTRGKVYMIGNTISRMCPYYTEFNLNAEHLKEGESNVILIDDENCEVMSKIVVHRCKSSGYNSGMFFGRANESITRGQYITELYPHLKKKLKDYRVVYTCVLEYDGFKYLMNLIYYDEDRDYVWYVQPKTSEIQKDTRLITNNLNRGGRRITSRFNGITPQEDLIFRRLFDGTKVYYSDNLTGTEFTRILPNFR